VNLSYATELSGTNLPHRYGQFFLCYAKYDVPKVANRAYGANMKQTQQGLTEPTSEQVHFRTALQEAPLAVTE